MAQLRHTCQLLATDCRPPKFLSQSRVINGVQAWERRKGMGRIVTTVRDPSPCVILHRAVSLAHACTRTLARAADARSVSFVIVDLVA